MNADFWTMKCRKMLDLLTEASVGAHRHGVAAARAVWTGMNAREQAAWALWVVDVEDPVAVMSAPWGDLFVARAVAMASGRPAAEVLKELLEN